MNESKPHGWVNPKPNETKARCGGPSLCGQCRKERDASWPVLDASAIPERPAVNAAKRMHFEPFEYTERN